jgi:hypothetical protein
MIELKPFDMIVCTDPQSIFSGLVRFGTKSPWSHVCVVSKDPNVIFTTTNTNYTAVLTKKYLHTRHYEVRRYKDGLTPEQIDLLTEFHVAVCNSFYSWVDVLQLAVFKLIGRGSKRLAYNTDGYFCSEAVCEGYKKAGIDIPLTPETTTPDDLSKLDMFGHVL